MVQAKARIAIIRVRGAVGLNPNIKRALKYLRLYRKNYCAIVSNTPDFLGMIRTVKDFTTFGELSKEAFIKLLQKRGKLAGDKPVTEEYLKSKMKEGFTEFADSFFDFKKELKDVPGMKTFFRLHPPIKGFERAGIKKAYAEGGPLGYRGKDINELIERMI